MAEYGPAKKLQTGWVKIAIDTKGRKHVLIAEQPWHLEKVETRHHCHYWEDSPGGKICQQVIHERKHILPPGYDAGDPSDWTEQAMRDWFAKIVMEYDTIRHGVFIFKNGDTYEGELSHNNAPHGVGRYVTRDGRKYDGVFRNGQFVVGS
jgi:hypothetical protein